MSKIIEHIRIPAGQSQSLVILNETSRCLHIEQEANSTLSIHLISIAHAAEHNIFVKQIGEGAQTDILGLALATENSPIHFDLRTHHLVPNGTSSSLCKYILQDNAKASFYGEVKVMPDAQHTSAKQTNRNILLSSTAQMRTEPQLEIYADDVQCSHGATTGQLDTAAIFYMQQRGIDLLTAKNLLIQAFLRDTYSQLNEVQRTQIETQIQHFL